MKNISKPNSSLKASTPLKTALHQENPTFPILGIGALAGGLDALEQFIRQVSTGCGLAFAIVKHLDPTHKMIITELPAKRQCRHSCVPMKSLCSGLQRGRWNWQL